MNVSILFNNFSAGEVSPLLAARTETAPYNYGCQILENFIPMDTGGVRKRPGTWFDGYTQGNRKARLLDFPLSDGSYVIVELSANKIRFWKDNFTLIQGLEITVPYMESQLFEVKYAVSKDGLWLVHPLYQVCVIAPDAIPYTRFSLDIPVFTGPDGATDAFTAAGDRPAAIAFDSGRLFLAATKNHPNAIWGSRAPDAAAGTDRYTDFTLETTSGAGPLAGDGIYIEENDMYGSRIKWIAANRMLLAATDRASWADTGEVPTPATFDMNIVEYAGANDVQGKGSKEVLVYAGRSGKSLRALIFNSTSQSSGYIDTDISEIAAHVLIAGIKDLAVMDYPLPMVWIALEDGSLVSCTLDLRKQIIAFSRHPMTGTRVESVAVCPGRGGDVLWLAVERGGERFIEHLLIGDVIGEDYTESHYVDSGVRREYPGGSTVVDGLGHLAGMDVAALADGSSSMPAKTVAPDGTVTYDEPVKKAHIGIPYTSRLSPNTADIPANGSSVGKKRRVEETILRLYESFGGKAGASLEKLEYIGYMRYGKYILGTFPKPFTGDQKIQVSGRIDPQARVFIVHDEPTPFNLLGLVERIAVMEG